MTDDLVQWIAVAVILALACYKLVASLLKPRNGSPDACHQGCAGCQLHRECSSPSNNHYQTTLSKNKVMASPFKHCFLSAILRNRYKFSGYANRRYFWWSMFYLFVVGLGVVGIAGILAGTGGKNGAIIGSMLILLWIIESAVVTISLSCRRLRDAGRSPWFTLLLLLSVVGFILLVILWCAPSAPARRSISVEPLRFGLIDSIVCIAAALLVAVGVTLFATDMHRRYQMERNREIKQQQLQQELNDAMDALDRFEAEYSESHSEHADTLRVVAE